MILKKKKLSFNFFKEIIKYFSNFIFYLGLLTFFVSVVLFIYYQSSGIKQNFPPKLFIKKIDTIIFDKYLGFSFFEIDDYISIKINNFKYLFLKNSLQTIKLEIDQENLYELELERKKKIDNKFYNFEKYSDALLNFKDQKYNIKLRHKGDRSVHWIDKDKASFKIDIKGDERLFGLEEFSLQKPITRNYLYEFIFHKLLDYKKLINLKYFFVNLDINNSNKGIFALEEGFSKELIERNKRRNGPIFGLNEIDGVEYPRITYDLYSKNYWVKNNYELVNTAYAKLNLLRENSINIKEIFELSEWAKFFAVIDFSNALHGSLSKSVKLFYNPSTGKFEPIGFDGHYYELNPANNFIILDFLDSNNISCNHICYDREWYNRFLKDKEGNPNTEFIDIYINELLNISNKNFLKEFKKNNDKEINYFKNQLMTETSHKDRALYRGLGFHIFNDDYLDKRSDLIAKRLEDILNKNNFRVNLNNNNKINFISNETNFLKKIKIICNNKKNYILYITSNSSLDLKKECNLFFDDKQINISKNLELNKDLNEKVSFDITKLNQLDYEDGIFYLKKDLVINENLFLPKNSKLIINDGVEISFLNNSVIESFGSIEFNGTLENPIKIFGNNKGSIVLNNNEYKIKNTILDSMTSPVLEGQILYGGINIILSELLLSNVKIINSKSEDAINIISSNSFIENLTLENLYSDAIDIDFGKVTFKKISCLYTNNDCLDVSGAIIEGQYLSAKFSGDKAISFGENSNGTITKVNLEQNKLAVAVKDGSKLIIKETLFLNNDYDLAIFKKKQEYEKASLIIENNKKVSNALIGKNNILIIANKLQKENFENKEIYNLFY